MGGVSRFTTEQREALARYDALVDAAPMRHADYKQLDFIESLLFPKNAKEHEKRNAREARRKAKQEAAEREAELAKQRNYYMAHCEQIKERKASYYQQNKERIAAQQRAYRQRRALSLAAAAMP